MSIPGDYIRLNKEAWNKRTAVHLGSAFYDVKGFKEGRSSLNATELALLGDVRGKTILHLQCHFGMDSLSLSRMGAKVTGADLSDEAIKAAEQLNAELGLDARFICCDVHDLPLHLEERFDLVFTSYGVLGWLPDMQRWARLVDTFLKPGGRLVLVEFHPVVWMYDTNFSEVQYSYFNTEPIIEEFSGTYADRNAAIQYKEVAWNHSLDEVFNGLLHNGFRITGFREYPYSHYNCFSGMTPTAEGNYLIASLGDKIPLMYSLTADKP